MDNTITQTNSSAPFPAYGALPDNIDGFGFLTEEEPAAAVSTEVNTAPNNPGYWEYTRTTFASPKPLGTIRLEIATGFNNMSVDFKQSRQHVCGYAGSVVSLGALIEFEVSIFAEGSGHMVEVRHMYGCRFAFGHFAENFAKELKVVYQGGGREIPFAPPPLPADFPVIEIPYDAVAQNCQFLHDRIEKGAPRESVLQGLRSISSMASDPTHASQFEAGGHAGVLAVRTAAIFNESGGDTEVRVTAMHAFANIAELKNALVPSAEINTSVLNGGLKDENFHVKDHAVRAALGLAQNGDLVKIMIEEGIDEAIKELDDEMGPEKAAIKKNIQKLAAIFRGN